MGGASMRFCGLQSKLPHLHGTHYKQHKSATTTALPLIFFGLEYWDGLGVQGLKEEMWLG